jgi:hypothetical protein
MCISSYVYMGGGGGQALCTVYAIYYIYVSERHLVLQFITSWDAAVLHGNGLGPVCRSEKNVLSPPETSQKNIFDF